MVNMDDTAKCAVMAILKNVFEGIAYLDDDTIIDNVKLACSGGMSQEDRSIRFGLANYLLNHMSLIYVGLIVNADFREAFKDAVSVEIGLDNNPDVDIDEIRNDLKSDKPVQNEGCFVLDMSHFNHDIYLKVNSKIGDSFGIVLSQADNVDSYIEAMTPEDMIDIGFCVSNFMYLIRAFSKNDLFAEYVKAVIHAVEDVFKSNMELSVALG